ncbi:MAG: hypothetical protein NTW21_07265 [Verrucomicrobia bacterium]|nr:hypothetical protein [Verrucomicrobiota bacterium]
MRLASVIVAAGLAAATLEHSNAVASNVRISVQLIEVQHPTLTELMAGKATSGDKLHSQAMALVRGGKAKVLETCIITTFPGSKATIESLREVIYPSDYEPSWPPGYVPPVPATPNPPFRLRPETPSAWDTRNTGVTLEIEPSVTYDKRVDLRFVSELVDPVALVTWMDFVDEWGDGSIRRPTFGTLRTNTSITIELGSFELAGILTPKPNAPAVSRKILVFVRADIPQQRQP